MQIDRCLKMNILKQISLQQIATKKDVIRCIVNVQPLQIRRFHHTKLPISSTKSLNCCYSISLSGTQKIFSHRQYSTENPAKQITNTTTDADADVEPKRTLTERIVAYFHTKKSVIAGQAVLLYGHGIDQLDHKEFISKFNMPNTFNSWFLITEIHVWMLMVRAMGERQHGELIRNNVVESLWSDVMVRTGTLAPNEASTVKKQIKELSGQFQYAIISYDEGLTKDDKQMASALWKRFFNSNCDNYEHIELMIKYIRYNIAALDKMTTEELLIKRKIAWPSLKDLENGKF